MSAKLDKIGADREKARKKRDEWDAKYKEQENVEIQDIVHAASLTPDQLAELIAKLEGNKKVDQESEEEVQDEAWS